jgi:hypothetical protein
MQTSPSLMSGGFTIWIKGGSSSTNSTDWQSVIDAYNFNPTIGQDLVGCNLLLHCGSFVHSMTLLTM